MKSLLSILLFLTCTNLIIAQQNIKGQIIDSVTKAPIPFVNIGIKKIAKGTVSDEKGNYELLLTNQDHLVTYSSIGYESKALLGKNLLKNGNIELIALDYQLEEVEISARKLVGKEQIFGVKNKTRGNSIGFGSRQLGAEIGALIRIKKATYLKSANFVLNHAKGDSMTFRVNIYDYHTGSVGKNLLKKNLILRLKQKKGTITVDLSDLNLILKGDVLLSLEWIKDDGDQGNQGLTFDTKKGRYLKGVYIKHSSIGDFKKLPYKRKLKPCFYFIGKQVS